MFSLIHGSVALWLKNSLATRSRKKPLDSIFSLT